MYIMVNTSSFPRYEINREIRNITQNGLKKDILNPINDQIELVNSEFVENKNHPSSRQDFAVQSTISTFNIALNCEFCNGHF